MPDTSAVTFLIFTTVTKCPELNVQMFFSPVVSGDPVMSSLHDVVTKFVI